MSTEQNKAIARYHLEEASKGNHEAAFDHVAPDVVWHGFGTVSGLEGWKQAHTMFVVAFPDFQGTIDDQVAEGDKVVTRFTFHGTHRGELQGIPLTGKQVAVPGMVIDRIADGKVVEHWIEFDQLGLMQQLGVIPAPEQSRS